MLSSPSSHYEVKCSQDTIMFINIILISLYHRYHFGILFSVDSSILWVFVTISNSAFSYTSCALDGCLRVFMPAQPIGMLCNICHRYIFKRVREVKGKCFSFDFINCSSSSYST